MDKNTLRDLLLRHCKKYPLIRPRDIIKLLYQGEFGGGHIVSDSKQSLERITAEHNELTYEPIDATEDIGNGLCRFELRAIPRNPSSLAALNRAFVAGSKKTAGDAIAFAQKLEFFKAIASEGLFPFRESDAFSYIENYINSGMPVERHSEEYRLAYSPAYRVMPKSYALCVPLMRKIEALLTEGKRVVIGIDGSCGSGKTSLASVLSEIYECPVVSMDDFFLPPEMRTQERLAEPGGNFHYERFLDEAAAGIKNGTPFSYRVFDCKCLTYSASKRIPLSPVLICEGSYSMHPLLHDLYNYRIFVRCGAQEQCARILRRNGPELYERFVNEWIPMENKYFKAFNIERNCDYIFAT